MFFFNIGKSCVFSGVKATITSNGSPVKSARVLREWEWNKLRSDEALTDENGNIEFSPIYEFSIARFLPIEFVVGQRLSIFIDDEQFVLWSNTKRNVEIYAEFLGLEINLDCEISNESKLYREFGSVMFTLCTLKS